jgi:catechol-2,3-dioxygenase
MAAVHRLNHAVLYVDDVDASVAFYRDILGFSKVAAFPGAAFMRAAGSTNDHDLGLFQIGPGAARPDRRTTGLYHLAWQVDTIEELAALRTRLLEARSLVGQSDHGVSKSLYAVDPSGIEFEVMWAVPQDAWPAGLDARPRELDLDGEVARWAGVATLGQLSTSA